MEVSEAETHEIVIVGAGIGGLATALALHRKGFRSLILEKSETLRATGAAIGIRVNGWRALEQLGVASQLRKNSLLFERGQFIWIDEEKQEVTAEFGESRCVERKYLVQTLADALPLGTVRFGCEVVSVKVDSQDAYPSLQLDNGKRIQAKVLIGCDGSKSVVANSLELKPTKHFAICGVQGLTNYPNGHPFAPEICRMMKGQILVGRIPVTDKSMYWFVAHQWTPSDKTSSPDPEAIKRATLEKVDGFPTDVIEMIEKAEVDSLSLTHLRHRAPWDLLPISSRFRRGTVTLTGDAMHVMGPFVGQGGCAALEDAVVLARCFGHNLGVEDLSESPRKVVMNKIGQAFDQYVQSRRMRLLALSTQTYLTGLLLENRPPLLKLLITFFMAIFFRDPNGHAKYDCGHL